MPSEEKAKALKRLFAEWRKLSPELDWECTEREARIQFACEVLHASRLNRHQPDPDSWSKLSLGEIKRLIRAVSERSGSAAAYRAKLIALLAAELFGAYWNDVLRARIQQRFQCSQLSSLSPQEARAEIEELVSRIAREQPSVVSGQRSVEEEIKNVRARVRLGARAEGGKSTVLQEPKA